MTADLTPHSNGGQRFEPESLRCCYLTLTIQIPFLYLLCHLGSVLSATVPWLWKMFQTQPHWSCMCSLPCSGCSDQKGGGCWRIQKHCKDTWTRGICSWVQWLKASHPSPRRQVVLSPPPCLLLQSAKQSTWPVPGNYRVPLDLSPALLSYIQISWVHIIKLIIVLTWKIQRLAWLRSTTFSIVD